MLTGRASAATISVMGRAVAATPARPDRPDAASSTRVFHAPQDGQRPAHLGWLVPHSVHRFLLMSRQPTQGVSRSTVTPERKGRPVDLTAEEQRLRDARTNPEWRLWGPYLSERQWGTVREDYSEGGDAWDYFTHDAARSRAYRWGEDGLAGQCDDQQRMCFAIALWNEQDAILKERLFGLTNSEGNHGEDVKEYYFYLDNVPTHSYQRWLYKYPQAAYPYDDLVRTNRARGPAGSRSTSCSTRACSTRVATSTSRSSTPRPAPRTWSSASRSPTGARTTRRSTCCPRCGSATPGRGRRTPRAPA